MTYTILPEIFIKGRQIRGADHQFTVEQDLSQPDMCSLTLTNMNHKWAKGENADMLDPGNPLEILIDDPEEGSVPIFQGEIVGLEPVYAAGQPTEIVVRAFNKLHRLLRGKNSETFKGTYQQIVEKIVKRPGIELTAECHGQPAINHEHVYQCNQTDLAFIRACGEKIGFDVWVEGDTLYFKPPQTETDSGIAMRLEEKEEAGADLESFYPRLSTAQLVSEVVVRGWNPETKEQIEGSASIKNSKLGGRSASTALPPYASKVYYEVDHPVFSVNEAQAIAEAKLREKCLDLISGEATCINMPKLRPGIVVDICVNAAHPDDRFNGKYFVVGATHRYAAGLYGYKTHIRVRRDAQGG